jgi:hypothetical protein
MASSKASVLHEEPLSRWRYNTLRVSAFAVTITALEHRDCLIPYHPSPFLFVAKNLGVKSLMKINKKYFGRALQIYQLKSY